MTTYRPHNNIFDYKGGFVDYKAMRRISNGLKVWFNEENQSLNDPLISEWKPVDVTFEASSSAKNTAELPDLSIWNMSCLVVSDKAKAALSDTLKNHGEIFPLRDGYHLFNCLTSIGPETIDPSRSSFAIDTSNEETPSTELPKKLALEEEKIKGVEIFKPSFLNNSFLICQSGFKRFIDENQLTGLLFDTNLVNIFPSDKG